MQPANTPPSTTWPEATLNSSFDTLVSSHRTVARTVVSTDCFKTELSKQWLKFLVSPAALLAQSIQATAELRRTPKFLPWPKKSRYLCKALLIGIAYPGQQWPSGKPKDLLGTHGDVELWRDVLHQCGYPDDAIRILWDKEGTPPDRLPTYENIVRAMEKLTVGVQPHHRRFFFFGGHRIETPHLDGNLTKAIVTCDGKSIFDSIMIRFLLKPLVPFSRMTIVLDACKVGIPFDLQSVPARVFVIGACSEHQVAKEVRCASQARFGALSYFLVEELRKVGPHRYRIRAEKIMEAMGELFAKHGQDISISYSNLDKHVYFMP
ncbi:Ca(2+)-dependent cysteine protease [Tulasnella sp. 403]|nr:Ca(2+)-dependent cysteine protease [Tulasnella sp. 403]